MNAKKYFGTDGIRGLANQHPITAEVALQVELLLGYSYQKIIRLKE